MRNSAPAGSSSDGESALLLAAAESHPTARYERNEGKKLEGVSRLCSKTVYSALDKSKCTEVRWVEYNDVPTSVLASFDGFLKTLLSFDHPNVIKHFAGWSDKKARTIVIITEHLAGDLRSFLAKKVEMSTKVYVRWIRQLCQALQFLHVKNNIAFLQLHPCNVLIRGSGEMKISGITDVLFQDVHFSEKVFPFMVGAPEMAQGVKGGAAQAVYQLGICILHMLSFYPPYQDSILPSQVYFAQQSGKPPELSLVAEKFPVAADLISRCLDPLKDRITLDQVLSHPFLADEGMTPEVFKLFVSPEPVRFRAEMALVSQAVAAASSSASLSSHLSLTSARTRHQVKCFLGTRKDGAFCTLINLGTVEAAEKYLLQAREDFARLDLIDKQTGQFFLAMKDKDGDLVVVLPTTLHQELENAQWLELHEKKQQK